VASPGIAKYLQYAGGVGSGAIFSTASPPKFIAQGTDSDTAGSSLRAFLRMFTPQGKWLWSQEMTRTVTGGVGQLSKWEWQSVYPTTGLNTIRKVKFGTGVTGGSWQMRMNGILTDPIPWGATFDQQKAILAKHPDFGSISFFNLSWNGATRELTVEVTGNRGRLHLDPWSVVSSLTGTGDKSLRVDPVQNGNSSFFATTGEYHWDVVLFDGSTWSGGRGGWDRRVGVGPTKCILWMDVAAVGINIDPPDNDTFDHPWKEFSWDFQPGTIGNVPIEWQRDHIYDRSTGKRVFDLVVSGIQENAAYRSFTSQVGARLKHGQSYDWHHDVRKASGLTSGWTHVINMAYTRPPALALTVTPGPGNAYLDLSWATSAESNDDFQNYILRLREQGVPAYSELNREVDVIRSKTTTTKRFWHFPFNTDVILSLTQTALRFTSYPVEGVPYEVPLNIKSNGIVIANPTTGDYVELPFHVGRSVSRPQTATRIQPSGLTAPVGVRSKARGREMEISAKLSTTGLTPQLSRAVWRKVELLHENAGLSPLIWRDAFGELIDCMIDTLGIEFEGGGVVPVGRVELFEISRELQTRLLDQLAGAA
jgi:hypothetical protein